MLTTAQENELWNIREILAGGCHDDGTPLSPDDIEELTDLKQRLEDAQ